MKGRIKTKSVLRAFWKYLRPLRWQYSALFLAVTLNYSLNLLPSLYYKKIFDLVSMVGISRVDAANQAIGFLLVVCGIQVVTWTLWRAIGLADMYLSLRVYRDMNVGSLGVTLNQSVSFFTDNFSGSLARKIRRFSEAFLHLSDNFFYDLTALAVTIVGALVILFLRDWRVGAVMLVGTVTIIIANVLFGMWKLKFDLIRADKDTVASGVLNDTLANNINVKMFASSKREVGFYRTVADELKRAATKSWIAGEFGNGAQAAVMIVLDLGIMIAAVKLWIDGVLTVGDFALVQTLLISIIERVWNLGRVVRKVYESLADATEMVEVMETVPGVRDVPRAKSLKVGKGEVVFDKVGFNYNQTRKVLNGLDLRVTPGERVAFVGPSGAGKSTVLKILLRFYDLDDGKILIDGQDIAKVRQDSLREAIAFVPQDPVLFHRTLRENIAYGRPGATERQIVAAAKKARCHDFIKSLPQGYETYVGERGIKLSGGERQRVAIARAILKDAPILVLDEATSSLDSESERLIQEGLEELMKQRTVFVIAHRLSTIVRMDRILVMDGGKIVDQGSHAELLVSKGLYRRLWNIQAGAFA